MPYRLKTSHTKHTKPYQIIPNYTKPYQTIPNHTKLYQTVSKQNKLNKTIPYRLKTIHTKQFQTMPKHTKSKKIISNHINHFYSVSSFLNSVVNIWNLLISYKKCSWNKNQISRKWLSKDLAKNIGFSRCAWFFFSKNYVFERK